MKDRERERKKSNIFFLLSFVKKGLLKVFLWKRKSYRTIFKFISAFVLCSMPKHENKEKLNSFQEMIF